MNVFPSFADFFRALWEKEPFPWQTMLADHATKKGLPDAIDLPTASGKTACIDIAVWALAKQADEVTRLIPRRIWFVVDRRIVVDEAYERAEKIAEKLGDKNASKIIRIVAERLLKLRGLPNQRERPLAVGRMRGGVLRDDRWARIPSQAAILTTTVDQLGSRLLFRGYGHSALAAPIFAGLAGNDSLIFLDEAHCAQPFLQTLRAVQMFRSNKWSEVANPTPFHVAVLSATPPKEDGGETPNIFPRDDAERTRALNHQVLQDRLTASKLALLETVKDEDKLARRIAEAAEAFARKGTLRVGIIVNRVDRAMEIADHLRIKAREKIADGQSPVFDVELLTGRIRPVERDMLVDGKLTPFLHSSPKQNPARPFILVSTQCLEVGADFSFDALVTECASLDALRQRFGRLARLGAPKISHALIVAAETAMKENDPIYGSALAATWDFLWEKATIEKLQEGKKIVEKRTIDFGFEEFRKLLPVPESDEFRIMIAPSSDAPILLPAHMDLLSQTSPRPHPDPNVSIFLHGKGRDAAEVRVAFRCDFDPDHPQNWPEIASLCPPVASEMFSLPLHRFRQWLENDTSTDMSGDIEGEQHEAKRGQSKRPSRLQFLLCGGREKSSVSNNTSDISAESIVILAAPRDDRGVADIRKLGQVLGNEGFGSEKVDLWEFALIRAGKRPAIRLNRDVLGHWSDDYPPLRSLFELLEDGEPSRAELDEAITALLGWKSEMDTALALPHWLCEIFKLVRNYSVNDIARHPNGGLVLRGKKSNTNRDETNYFSDEDDASSEAPEEILLQAHCSQVAAVAEKLATACLNENAALISKTAGDWHDAGKLDPRFQEILRNGACADGEPLAKSPRKPRSCERAKAIREAAGLPEGFRHEMLSAQLAQRVFKEKLSPEDHELLLHLIASHHGYARPFAPVCEDNASPAIEGKLYYESVILSADERHAIAPSHRLDSGVTDRFWLLTRRFGWWGLAYREAILRLADWYASEHPDSGIMPNHE